MSTTTQQFRDGDVFRWRYTREREARIRQVSCDPYWAKSCIAVFRHGVLFDTFWASLSQPDSNSIRWMPKEASELELTYLGNLDDYEVRPEYHSEYYAESDCLNLNHSNRSRGNFFVRKGAQRSRERMLEVAQAKLATAESEERSAKRQAERYREVIAQLNYGFDLKDLHL